jgi:hypothetical protein
MKNIFREIEDAEVFNDDIGAFHQLMGRTYGTTLQNLDITAG